MISKVAAEFSAEVLSIYVRERGDRLLYIMTEVAEKRGIEIDTIQNYVTPHLLEMLTTECRQTHLIEDIPEAEKTFELF